MNIDTKDPQDGRPHIPDMLLAQEQYPTGSERDERQMRVPLPPLEEFSEAIKDVRTRLGDVVVLDTMHDDADLVLDLIQALGRVPSPAEVRREEARQSLVFNQPDWDMDIDSRAYATAEIVPQREVIARRALDFPSDPAEWVDAPAEIRKGKGETQLIITTSNQQGGVTEHPVMTTAELPWVRACADVIADHAGQNGTVFIGGLGLGLLNQELKQRGVGHQVVAEINNNVIKLVEPPLQAAMGGELDVRQGDWKATLRQAVENGERFDAISIDAFPNSADEVNRDASSEEAITLAFSALKPGGVLTFYPDSRYLPERILRVLHGMEIPKSCIHYTVAKFNESSFTRRYHYGDLMAVPCIVKPRLTDVEEAVLLLKEYQDGTGLSLAA